MITDKQYKNNSERYWVGKKVRLLREANTRGGKTFPVGFEMIITRKHTGFHLESQEVCPTCGVGHKHYLSQIHHSAVELIEE